MAKSRQQKEATIQELTQSIKDAKSAVFANFQGLKVKDMDELRKLCREQDVKCSAVKKTLVKRALQDAGLEVDAKSFNGSIATFLGMADEVAPAQIVAKFAKDHDVVKVFGGLLEGNFIESEKVIALSKLPGKQEMLAKLVGTLNAPVSGFVNVLAGNLRGFVGVLNAIKEQKS